MPRHKYKKTRIKPDKLYNSYELAKLINYLTINGEKAVAEKLVYQAFDEIKKQGLDPLKTFYLAIDNTSPSSEVKPRRLGGASYLVPIEVRKDRKLFLALNWIIEGTKARSNKEYKNFYRKLTAEIIEASKNLGAGVSKKQAAEKLAETNKAFSHLKW